MEPLKQKLLKLAAVLNTEGLILSAQQIIKLAEEPLYLYAYIPTESKKSVKEHGLVSQEYIKDDPKLLKELFPEPTDQEDWLKKYNPNDITTKGASIWFSKPDTNKILKLDKRHPLSNDDYTLVKINYSKLKEDEPETKIFGTELIPYEDQDYEKLKKKIEHDLTEKEIAKLSNLSFEETWKHYLKGKGFWSPNVPHGIIITPDKCVMPEYIEFVD